MSQTQSTYQRMTTTTTRMRRPKEREVQSVDRMEQELRGKYAISMETVTLVAGIKVIFPQSGVRPANSARMTKAAILMNWTSEV